MSIDKEIEQILVELVDQIVKDETETKTSTTNALSLLQNFVTKQTPTIINHRQSDLNNNYDDENSNLSSTDKSPSNHQFHREHLVTNDLSTKSNDENPLLSLEKMLSHPTTTIQSLSSTIHNNETMINLSNNSIMTIKKKKFDKYRLFAEKMIRSTLS